MSFDENDLMIGKYVTAKEMVDKYVNYLRKPIEEEFMSWSKEVQEYFNVQWEKKSTKNTRS